MLGINSGRFATFLALFSVGWGFCTIRRQTGPRKSNIQAEITAFEPNKHFSTQTIRGPQAGINYVFHTA